MDELTSRMFLIEHEEKIINLHRENSMILFTAMSPKLYRDGNMWCCLYGADLQSGICGFGNSPFEAIEDFNKAMNKA